MKLKEPCEISVQEDIFKNKFMTTICFKIKMSFPVTEANKPEKFSSIHQMKRRLRLACQNVW